MKKNKKLYLPKNISWFRLPEYIQAVYEAEPDNTAVKLLAFDEEGQFVTVDKGTISGGGSGGGTIESITGGTDIDIDDTDPANLIINSTVGSTYLPLAGGSVTGDIDFDENTLENLGEVYSQQFRVISGEDALSWTFARGVFSGGQDLDLVNLTGDPTKSYKLNNSGTPEDPKDLVTKEYADANYSGGSGGSATKYNLSFVSSDFVGSSITITAATHGVGTKPITQVYDSNGQLVFVDITRTTAGNVTISVTSGNEFDGDLTII